MKKLITLILVSIILFSCKKGNASEGKFILNYTKQTFQYKFVAQTDSNLLSLDVYFDNDKLSKSLPVIIWVHGGAWCIGDKSSQMANKKDLFAKMGYILVSINYRLSPYPYETTNANRIKFPTHSNDVADATKWVYDHIADYGGNPDKIALIGHSAGAHLVSLTGTNFTFLQQAGVPLSAIKGIASIDTRMYDVYSHIQNAPPVDMYINAFGTNPQENTDASPIRNIRNGLNYPNFFIAKRGTPDRVLESDIFIDSLQQAGISVTQIEGEIYNHTEINDAIGKEGETLITNPLKQFLIDCFQ